MCQNKLSEVRRSIEAYTPNRNELFYSPQLGKLNSSVPKKKLNTYVGFPLAEDPRFRNKNKNRNDKFNASKNKKKNQVGFSKKKIMNEFAKISKDLIVDLKYYDKEPINTSDV